MVTTVIQILFKVDFLCKSVCLWWGKMCYYLIFCVFCIASTDAMSYLTLSVKRECKYTDLLIHLIACVYGGNYYSSLFNKS